MDAGQFPTLRQAAELAGVHSATLGRIVRRGALPAFHRPVDRRQKLVRRDDVERLARIEPVAIDRVPHRPAALKSGVPD